ncbi:hypothetical protein CDAR_184311 [Caerostris darwini]|uniref:FAD dependent oxidoreductase domain-containing protein n=1 Tax=Caerostris darwini TaxID=1538125 RepID=A0AAV4UG32_9ARAC|nr:hypothetical protein CDAR_184311 [Caerostris darwini]
MGSEDQPRKVDEQILFDDNGGGHISPRNLVVAQKKVARMQGCHIVDSVACSTETLENGIHVVSTESNEVICAKRLLIATGAFVNMKNLSVLKPLKVTRCKETVVYLKLEKEEAQRLSAMPSIIYAKENNGTGIGAYILPPIKYPDGEYYIKIGDSPFVRDDVELKTLEELRKWYLSEGNEKMVKTHVKLLTELIPGLKYTDIHRRTCATCETPSGLPYIERVSPTVTVAIAGNGKGAKFSDEVGRIAAELSITGKWNSELSPNLFQAIFE